jgi:hypothetical protein
MCLTLTARQVRCGRCGRPRAEVTSPHEESYVAFEVTIFKSQPTSFEASLSRSSETGSSRAERLLSPRERYRLATLIRTPRLICLRLFMHAVRLAFSLALLSAGNNRAARIPMKAITTSNSTRVNPRRGPKRAFIIALTVPGTMPHDDRQPCGFCCLLKRREEAVHNVTYAA